jgi:DASS family divalent anion:Na+ symporter
MLMLAFNIIDRAAFKAKIGWDSIYFIGGILCLASAFPALGVDKWIASVVGPMMKPLISNMYLFVIVIPIILFFLRFVLVSQTASLMIFVVLLTPLAQAAGVHSLVPAFIVLTSVNLWNVIYQNTTFLAGFYASNGMVRHPQTIKMSVAYAACNIVALLASVPLWKIMGLVP